MTQAGLYIPYIPPSPSATCWGQRELERCPRTDCGVLSPWGQAVGAEEPSGGVGWALPTVPRTAILVPWDLRGLCLEGVITLGAESSPSCRTGDISNTIALLMASTEHGKAGRCAGLPGRDVE